MLLDKCRNFVAWNQRKKKPLAFEYILAYWVTVGRESRSTSWPHLYLPKWVVLKSYYSHTHSTLYHKRGTIPFCFPSIGFFFFLKKKAADRNLNSRPQSHEEEEGGDIFYLEKTKFKKMEEKVEGKDHQRRRRWWCQQDGRTFHHLSSSFLFSFIFLLLFCLGCCCCFFSIPPGPARPSSDGKEGMDRVTLGLRQWSDERRFSPFLISLLLSCPDVLHNNTKGARFIFFILNEMMRIFRFSHWTALYSFPSAELSVCGSYALPYIPL